MRCEATLPPSSRELVGGGHALRLKLLSLRPSKSRALVGRVAVSLAKKGGLGGRGGARRSSSAASSSGRVAGRTAGSLFGGSSSSGGFLRSGGVGGLAGLGEGAVAGGLGGGGGIPAMFLPAAIGMAASGPLGQVPWQQQCHTRKQIAPL